MIQFGSLLELRLCERVYIATLPDQMEATMPVILWLLGVPLVLVIALMLTRVI
jgi:hypothetical protein